MLRWLETLDMNDVQIVGGKNASLGEMIQSLSTRGVRVPGGFATTAQAYQAFLSQQGLDDKIHNELSHLDIENLTALADTGQKIRTLITEQAFSKAFIDRITESYQILIEP